MAVKDAIKGTPTDKPVFFITGVTGVLASEFLAEVITQIPNAQCWLLVRSADPEKAQRRIDNLLRYLFTDENLMARASQNVQAICGDVGERRLGMTDSDWNVVSQTTHYIIHAAAETDLNAPLARATKVNINGVRNILQLAAACGSNLKRLLHVSTAYISGAKTGTISTEELYEEVPPCDHYQLTKRKGELLLRAYLKTIPITIIRPTIIMGNSINGRCLKFRTPYYPLQQLYNRIPLVLPVAKGGNLEMIPADWAAQVMLKMVLDPNTIGRCFHLSNGDKVMNNLEYKHVVYEAFQAVGEARNVLHYLPFPLYRLFVSPMLKKRGAKGYALDESARYYRNYATYKRVFDNSTTMALLNQYHLTPPEIEDYFPKVMSYAIDHRWKQNERSNNPQATVTEPV